jgi:hypothetical protein
VFWQVFCFSKCSPFVPFSSHDIWWISQNKEGKNWTKPIARGFTLHKSDSCKLHKIPALHCWVLRTLNLPLYLLHIRT